MKYSLTYLPSTVIANVCFVLSQREVKGTIETFSVFNILSAVSMVYIVFTSNEDRYMWNGNWAIYCQARVQVPNPLSQQALNPDPKFRPSLNTQKSNYLDCLGKS